MLARCAALCAACSFREKLTRACKVQAQINSPRFIDTHKTQTELTQVGALAGSGVGGKGKGVSTQPCAVFQGHRPAIAKPYYG
ncbi:hypothetical protein J6590_035976 [Homalodisca vitripennis]|nr:hypothetical protein J6590_035976 [Homalodisca vitripennis]